MMNLKRISLVLGSAMLAFSTVSAAYAEELVELVNLDPTLRLDIRYASDRNFLGFSVYPEARAFLQRDAAEAIKKVNGELRPQGLGLLILDAYRPHSVTQLMWDKTPASKRAYVADPKQGSRHNRGAAVDLTILELATGRPIAMPSFYDDFSEKAHHSYQGGSERARRNRAKLKAVMENHGFQALDNEWWHYDFQGWEKYPILDKPFSEI
jgi:zinc D-Ala-D-Ala dipeptidase